MGSDQMTHLCQANISSQITDWWQEAEEAVRAGHIPRARRFLRWIVACCPEEEEGWIVLARLMADSQEQMPLLRRAYRFHPHSQRVQVALREARRRQLESAVGELKSRWPIPNCLPGERDLQRQASAVAGNGHRSAFDHASKDSPHPLQAEDSYRPWPLASLWRLLQREPTSPSDGGIKGQGQSHTSRREI